MSLRDDVAKATRERFVGARVITTRSYQRFNDGSKAYYDASFAEMKPWGIPGECFDKGLKGRIVTIRVNAAKVEFDNGETHWVQLWALDRLHE